ncbi:MAG: porin family protein [Cyclobacteriaceae bacterium]|nr:porin family protein [Cyclobacteriaceae bacterium]MDX5465745.1 porin family protein [Cyclobacteriaceae bacterium]
MKKLFLSLSFILALATASLGQQVISSSSGNPNNPNLGNFNNEVKINFLNLIMLASFEIGYEKFLSESHSIEIQGLFNDRFGYNNENDGKKYKTNSVQAAMHFYFGNNPNGRFHVYPLMKFRVGDFEEVIDGAVKTTDMASFIIGAGVGYKWEVSEHFAFGPYASIARGFSEQVNERFSEIELNGGFSLGYRF